MLSCKLNLVWIDSNDLFLYIVDAMSNVNPDCWYGLKHKARKANLHVDLWAEIAQQLDDDILQKMAEKNVHGQQLRD